MKTGAWVAAILASLLLTGAAANGGRDYIVKTIACDAEEERCVAASYECFIALLSDKRIAAGTLRLPRTLVIERGGNLIFERAYYISRMKCAGFLSRFLAHCWSKKMERSEIKGRCDWLNETCGSRSRFLSLATKSRPRDLSRAGRNCPTEDASLHGGDVY